MKKTSIFLTVIAIIVSFESVYGQSSNKSKLELRDFSTVISSYKIFSTHSDLLPQFGEQGYDINYLLGLFYMSFISQDSVFTITPLAEGILSKKTMRRRYLKRGRKIAQYIHIYGSKDSDIRYLGRNMYNHDKVIDYFNIKTPEFEGCVYQTISTDNGKNWQPPTIAIKHNNINLHGWDIIDPIKKRKKYGLTTILTDDDNRIYLSNSQDKGKTWSYPSLVLGEFQGVNFNSSMRNNELALVFKLTKRYENFANGDVLVWFGKYNDMVVGKYEGELVRVSLSSSENVTWKIKHTANHNVFLIKSTETSTGVSIEGYLFPPKIK